MVINNIFTNIIAEEFINIDVVDFCNSLSDGQYLPSFKEPELQELLSVIKLKFNELHKVLGFSDGSYQELYNACINKNSNKYIETAHSHPRNFFTAVYYPTNYGSSLLLFNPIMAHTHVIPADMGARVISEFNEFNSSTWTIVPEAGKLVIFPSWLVHQVLPNNDSRRLSIAFNSRLIIK